MVLCQFVLNWTAGMDRYSSLAVWWCTVAQHFGIFGTEWVLGGKNWNLTKEERNKTKNYNLVKFCK